MNRNQAEFAEYWDKIANAIFYRVPQITEGSSFADKVLDNQRKKLSRLIKKEIDRTFFDEKFRPKATVWLEELRKDYPKEADRFERFVKSCKIKSKGPGNILAIAGGGMAAVAGAAVGKKKPRASALLILGGVATSGCKIVSGLNVDTAALQKEVKKQFEVWKASLLNILEDCNDADYVQNEDEQ